MTWSKRFDHVTQLYKNLNILKLNEVYMLELAKFMHKLKNNKLPRSFQQRFTKTTDIHSYPTRNNTESNYYLHRACKDAGQKTLQFRGVKLWNDIDNNIKNKGFIEFKKRYKELLMENYQSD